jgi:uncharacterized delta-60 repeat protein
MMRILFRVLALIVASGLMCASASAAPGDLDGSFSVDGKVTTNFTSGSDVASAVAIQADGKIVAGGGANFDRFAIARYNPDGTPDTNFSGNGKRTTTFAGGDTAAATAVAIQADGKIVAAGWSFTAPGVGAGVFTLVRYNADGSLDSSFSGDGRVRTDFLDGDERVEGVVIQADGKIVAAGWAKNSTGSSPRFALARYDADGTLDTSFGVGGRVLTGFGPDFDKARAASVAIQADGKLVVAGKVSVGGAPKSGRFALARYNVDGTLDGTFSRDGKATTNFRVTCSSDCSGDGALGVATQADGKIVAAGFANSDRFALARYRSGGRLDGTFSGDGKLTTRFRGGALASGVAIQATGNIVAVGEANRRDRRFALARYTPGGSLDETFSADGKATTNFTTGDDAAADVAVQANGMIVAAGRASERSGRFAIARYEG